MGTAFLQRQVECKFTRRVTEHNVKVCETTVFEHISVHFKICSRFASNENASGVLNMTRSVTKSRLFRTAEKVCMQVPCQRSTKYGASQICYQKPALPHGPRTYECKCSAKGTLSNKHLKSVIKAGSSARSESVRIANALQKENEW